VPAALVALVGVEGDYVHQEPGEHVRTRLELQLQVFIRERVLLLTLRRQVQETRVQERFFF